MTRDSLVADPVANNSVADPKPAACRDRDGYAEPKPDWFFRTLVGVLFAASVWLLAMPFVPAIASCTMHRFHLKTGSYALWAIQQPIPPMYSFANTTEVRNLPPAAAKDEASTGRIAGRLINHFPTREFTFANGRVRYLLDRSSRWFVFKSTYRGQTLNSVYRLDPAAENGWTVTLLDENGSHEENKS